MHLGVGCVCILHGWKAEVSHCDSPRMFTTLESFNCGAWGGFRPTCILFYAPKGAKVHPKRALLGVTKYKLIKCRFQLCLRRRPETFWKWTESRTIKSRSKYNDSSLLQILQNLTFNQGWYFIFLPFYSERKLAGRKSLNNLPPPLPKLLNSIFFSYTVSSCRKKGLAE